MVNVLFQRAPREFQLFVVLVAAGVLLGNVALIVLSLIPLLLLALYRYFGSDLGVRLDRKSRKLALWVGDKESMECQLKVKGGVGIVTVADLLPPQLRLVEGSNVSVLWKGPWGRTVDTRYSIEGSRRGRHTIGPVRVGWVPFSFCEPERVQVIEDRVGVLVQQRPVDIKKLRDTHLTTNIPMPAKALARLGAQTTDFREIREYTFGDRFRSINWKATVRRGKEDSLPLVNDYETEGRRTVLILLDSGPGMSAGTATGTVFEHAVQAALGFSQFYLSHSCEVGLRAYGGEGTVLPRAGRRQEGMISELLLELEIGEKGEHPLEAVKVFHPYLRRDPMVLIITSIRQENFRPLEESVRRLLALLSRKGRVVVINVSGDDPLATTDVHRAAAQLLEIGAAPLIRRLNEVGAAVFTWNPRALTFQQFMVLKMRRGAP